MEYKDNNMYRSVTKWQNQYGLIGQSLAHSFSPRFFYSLFAEEGLDKSHRYDLFSLPDTEALSKFLEVAPFHGCNVTIPYKETVVKHCLELKGHAKSLGVVNTLLKTSEGIVGFNTDINGVVASFKNLLERKRGLDIEKDDVEDIKLLIFGRGGAGKAVAYTAKIFGWQATFVSRKAVGENLDYHELATNYHLNEFDILVNATPLGMSGFPECMPDINKEQISEKHMVFDLIYNPRKTLFLKFAEQAGATILNGQLMLEVQALTSWDIWRSNTN